VPGLLVAVSSKLTRAVTHCNLVGTSRSDCRAACTPVARTLRRRQGPGSPSAAHPGAVGPKPLVLSRVDRQPPKRGNMIIGAHGGRPQSAQDPHRTHLGPDGVRFLIQSRGPQAPLPYRWPQGTGTRRHVVPRGQVARSSTSTTFSVPSRADRSRPSRNPLGRAFLGGFTQSPRGDPSHAGTSTTSSTPPTSYTTWCDDPSGSTVTCRRAPAESDDVAVSERSTAVSGSAAARHRRTGTTAVVKILVFTA
jgi:hypothetical protein